MSKSTHGSRGGRVHAGFEYFDRRQSGPWIVLRMLFRGWGLVLTLALAVLLIVWQDWNPYVVLGLLVFGFVASFAVVWHAIALLIRARAILVVAGVLVAANLWFTTLFGEIAGNIALCVLLGLLLTFAPTRRFLVSRGWCVFDRMRFRACLKVCKVRTMNLDGALPFLLWATPTKTGERVWMWIRAGASGEDIDDALKFLAAACLAREARLHTVRTMATLVAVDIIRRDPLATTDPIPSPLARLSRLSPLDGDVTGEGTEAIRPASMVEITTVTPVPVVPEPRKARKTTNGSAEPANTVESVVVVSGEDLSDYVD